MRFELLRSLPGYRGRAFGVRRDEVRLPDGRVTWFDIVEHSGAITIVPVDDQGQVWFVRQYRHATGIELLELPAGTLKEGEDPQLAAQRELREEIGMQADSLQLIGEFYLAPGYSTEYMYIYLATGLSPAPLAQDDDEFLAPEAYPLRDLHDLMSSGAVRDAKTLLGLHLALHHLG